MVRQKKPGRSNANRSSRLVYIRYHFCIRTPGLKCPPEKSEYITIPHSHTNKADAYRAIVQLNMAEEPIPRRKVIGILEFTRQQEGGGTNWLRRTLTQVGQITHTMTRISKRRSGLRENEPVKIAEGTIYSRIMRGVLHVTATNSQRRRFEAAQPRMPPH